MKFMWQDDIIGVARFLDACLERVYTSNESAGPRRRWLMNLLHACLHNLMFKGGVLVRALPGRSKYLLGVCSLLKRPDTRVLIATQCWSDQQLRAKVALPLHMHMGCIVYI